MTVDNLRADGVRTLLSPSTSLNLVIASGALTPGGSYRAQLTATAGDVFGSAEIVFIVNMPPANGSLSVTPRVGMSLVDSFVLSEFGWDDQDIPLSYRFSHETAAGLVPVSVWSSADHIQGLDLPSGEGNASCHHGHGRRCNARARYPCSLLELINARPQPGAFRPTTKVFWSKSMGLYTRNFMI